MLYESLLFKQGYSLALRVINGAKHPPPSPVSGVPVEPAPTSASAVTASRRTGPVVFRAAHVTLIRQSYRR